MSKTTTMVETIREIAAAEVRRLHVTELGTVTSVFPHSDSSDNDNYECNVQLKNRSVELRKVPVATQHIGLANIPHVGDLVAVTFIGGDINAPIVIGRLYNDADRPPQNKMEQIVYKPPYDEDQNLERFHIEFPSGMTVIATDEKISINAGQTTIAINKDGDVQIQSGGKVTVDALNDLTIQSSSGDLSLSANNVKVQGQMGVDIKAGTSANFECSGGPTSVKGAIVNIN
jgi:uncharacterized protein involved in type VI secretion and phage assembly